MNDFLMTFHGGAWWRIYKRKMSLGMKKVLTQLLARDPQVRGDIDTLLNEN